MKKVLIVTYYWPPASGPGVQRFLKFVKYFSSFGIHASVLTVKDGSYPAVDETLLDDIPMEVTTHRTRAIEPFRIYNFLRGKKGKSVEVGMGNLKETKGIFSKFSKYLRSNIFIPDARVGWNPYAIREAVKILKNNDIETIITTGPPHSSHLIGLYLKRNRPSIKWIADLRDPWTTIMYEQYLNRNEKSKARNQKMEDEVLSEADHVVVISNGMKNEFSDRAKAISFIPNGYDGEDISMPIAQMTPVFKLSYIGNFKINQNIKSFWDALNELCKEYPGFNSDFRLELIGNINKEIKQSISEADLDNHVAYHDFVPHDMAVKKMMATNLLYLPIPQDKNNKSIITGKIFEYMASHTPILSIGPVDGDAAHILEYSERGPMLEYHDKAGIKSKILEEFKYWQTHSKVSRKEESENYRKYDRKELTKTYADLIRSL